MGKALLLNNGMKFQGLMFADALDRYFDEVDLFGANQDTSYIYPMKNGINKYLIDETTANRKLHEYDLILALEQGSFSSLKYIQNYGGNKKDAVFGVHVLDYPNHLVNYRYVRPRRQHLDAFWGEFKKSGEYFDFIAHNQNVALKHMENWEMECISEFVRYPVRSLSRSTKTREELGIEHEKFIVYSGRIVPDKGVHLALSALAENSLNVALYVIGSGYDFSDFANYLGVSYKLFENINEQEKWDIYHESLATIFAGNHGWIPTLCVLEGISIDVPGIAFDYEENRLHYDKYCLYAEPGNIDSLSECITLAYIKSPEYEELKSGGSQWVAENCTYEVWAKSIYDLYERARDKK